MAVDAVSPLFGRRSTTATSLSKEEQATLAALLRKVSDNAEHALTTKPPPADILCARATSVKT
ncbi:hypothetical protein SAMN04487914_14324 [Arthrobacter sp. ok909]|nr:hypothetical protein SAMN04487914_14324 [Arthrobacter sp. ok909]